MARLYPVAHLLVWLLWPLLDLLGDLEDPRSGSARLHDFRGLLMPAPSTVLFVDCPVRRHRQEGLPARLTQAVCRPAQTRVYRILDPETFSARFQRFIAAFGAQVRSVIAVDGNLRLYVMQKHGTTESLR